jgi:Tfp pilus assembly protein PilF
VGQLVLVDQALGDLVVSRLELEVTDLGTDPGPSAAERFQRRRTRLRAIAMRASAAALEARVEAARRHLAGLGVTNIQARLGDGYVSVRARATDGLATADVSFRVVLVHAGTHLRALASHIRVHGHLPTAGPVLADRVLGALLGASDAPGVVERPHARGLCDVELDVVGALLWQLMPPAGWRLPAVAEIELSHARITRAASAGDAQRGGAVDIAFGPSGTRTGDIGVRPFALQLAAAHDLVHSVDQQLRAGHVEDAMRGYRALLAAGGPEQPHLLERILALAAARPAWFHDGLELARQALGRWPNFPAAHAALASIALAQGDARVAADHLAQLARIASGDADDDQAVLAALAAARLLRVLDPRAATQLYGLALEHDPTSTEAADSLADRLADEQRWAELVRLLRTRIAIDPARAVALRLRIADVLAHQLGDLDAAQGELAAARALAPDDSAVHEMTATILTTRDPAAAISAWREIARLAEARGDRHVAARAYATLGELSPDAGEPEWRRALELDPLQDVAIANLALAAARGGQHATAVELYERLRGLGIAQELAARYELQLATSLIALDRFDDARAALRRTLVLGDETSAEGHVMLAELAMHARDREHAAAELDTAIAALLALAEDRNESDATRLFKRAAELALARAQLFDETGAPQQASAEYERAHELAAGHAPEVARGAARTMLSRAADAIGERRWIDAVLATRPPAGERASLLVLRADVRRRERTPDLAAALGDLHEAIAIVDGISAPVSGASRSGEAGPFDELGGDDTASSDTRRRAYELEAELFAASGDARARAQALAALARMAERSGERVAVETAAASAWLAADDSAQALQHGARAHSSIERETAIPVTLRREVLTTLGEAAWRQRAWADVIRAYRGLIDEPGVDATRIGGYRYRLAVAADRTGDPTLATTALAPLVYSPSDDAANSDVGSSGDDELARLTPPDVRSLALRLFADLAERAGDLVSAATALESFAGLELDGPASGRADAWYRAGELFRRAERGDDAVRCLEGALRVSDAHLPALDALELAWRERGDLERVCAILGRKVAATTRHPARQKPLLSRLAELQAQLGRPDVALATHQRALEIDPTWRPSLRYVTAQHAVQGAALAAAAGYAQLSGELASDGAVDGANLIDERTLAARALAQLVAQLDGADLRRVPDEVARVLERFAGQSGEVAAALARLRGEPAPRESTEDLTPNGRVKDAPAGALSLRDAAARARAAGKLDDAFATLEAANHVSPGNEVIVSELVALASELGDHEASADYLTTLAEIHSGARRGETLLQLADVCYDKLGDAMRARDAMRAAADSFGAGARRDATLRLLANESAAHLAWDVAAAALEAIDVSRRTSSDIAQLAAALARGGKTGDAVELLERAVAASRGEDEGALLAELRAEAERKLDLARALEQRAHAASGLDAAQLRAEANELRRDVGRARTPARASVLVTGTPAETAVAVAAAAAAADRERLLAAHRAAPEDPSLLLALLAHLGDREPALRRDVLEQVARAGAGRTSAIALHELATAARNGGDGLGAAELWTRAHRADPSYAPVWMPLADALASADDLATARVLYEQVAASNDYEPSRRMWAAEQADLLGRDESIVSGEIAVLGRDSAFDLTAARDALAREDLVEATAAAERAADLDPDNPEALELLEELYFAAGNVTAASEAIGRQLVVMPDAATRAVLWRRRAKLYREALGREPEAYRCLKEAHACAPGDVDIAYELRVAAMVRGEWALVASLLYREIDAANGARERGALHLELAMIYEERLADPSQAQVNFEQALALDPTIPAARSPLARRYEAVGRYGDAARLYEESAAIARPAERGALLAAASRCRAMIELPSDSGSGDDGDPAARLERAEAAGDLDGAATIANELWDEQPGNVAAFRVLANGLRLSGDLRGLIELTTAQTARASMGEDRAHAWLDVARLAEELGRDDDAATAYDRALRDAPMLAAALDARAALAFRLGEWATADALYSALSPADSVLGLDEVALRRSAIAEQLGRDGEALAFAQEAVAAAPGRRDLHTRVQELATEAHDLRTAIEAARTVLGLVPIDDHDAHLSTVLSLARLHRDAGEGADAIGLLDRIVRDHPHNVRAIEMLAELHADAGDWRTATRYLYLLVALAPSPGERADRLYRLGEATLLHLGDVDRADDVFLRASDLDPSHEPTLRRLLDVYWRAGDPAAIVEVAAALVGAGALGRGPITGSALARAVVAAALVGDTRLVGELLSVLGTEAPPRIADALSELASHPGRVELASASTAIAELGKRGLVDLNAIRAAASGTPVEPLLLA